MLRAPSSTYTLTDHPQVVVRDVDQLHIPNQADNMDWQTYQAWLTAGNTPNAHVAPPKTKQQEAQAWLDGGLTVNFTSGGSVLSGTYPVVEPHNHTINSLATSLSYDGNAFPMGATTAIIIDIHGAAREFDKSSFKLLVRAIRDFVYVTHLYAGGHMPALPPNVTTKSIEELDEATPT